MLRVPGAVLVGVGWLIAASAQERPAEPDAQAESAVERLKAALEAASANRVTPARLAALLDAYNQQDLDAIMEFLADDAVLDLPRGPDPWGSRITGKAGIRKALAGWFRELPGARYGEARHLVIGNRGFSEWTLTGKTPEGEAFAVRGCDLFEFRDGRIVRKDTFWKIVDR